MSFKKKIYISIIVFFGLTTVLIVFVIYPLFLEIKKISQEFFSQRQAFLTLEKKVENLEKFKIIFSEISPNLKKIDNFFVNPEIPIDFIRFLEKTSQDLGLSFEISLLGSSLKIEKNPWPFFSFQLNLIGSFSNFSKFLEKLESGPYLIEIQNLTINRLEEDELRLEKFEKFSLGDVKSSILIKVYTK